MTSQGCILSFSRASSDLFLCPVSCTPVVMVIIGLPFHPIVFNVSMKGSLFLFLFLFFSLDVSR